MVESVVLLEEVELVTAEEVEGRGTKVEVALLAGVGVVELAAATMLRSENEVVIIDRVLMTVTPVAVEEEVPLMGSLVLGSTRAGRA